MASAWTRGSPPVGAGTAVSRPGLGWVGLGYHFEWVVSLGVPTVGGCTRRGLWVEVGGCVSVSRPHDDGGKWPHLGRLEDQVTEVSGPTGDTPGVV
jgi:hypothetical protein